jgi:hypothetical protein
MDTRTFHLGDILSVTTGWLVSPRHMDGIYDILNYMTGDNLFINQLSRAVDECAPMLLAQHPDLAGVPVPDSFGVGDEDSAKVAVDRWLAEQVAIYGETLAVAPLAAEDHTYIDPTTELRAMMRPDAKIIVVAGDEGDAR